MGPIWMHESQSKKGMNRLGHELKLGLIYVRLNNHGS